MQVCSVNKGLLFECDYGCNYEARLGIELMLAKLKVAMAFIGVYNARRAICNLRQVRKQCKRKKTTTMFKNHREELLS